MLVLFEQKYEFIKIICGYLFTFGKLIRQFVVSGANNIILWKW